MSFQKKGIFCIMPISEQRHTELMKLCVDEMSKSKSEHTDRTDPLVGAILVDPNGEIIEKAHRGELRKGDHAEYTLLERKLRDKHTTGAVLYTTLEPCVERKPPKCGCTFRAINARVAKVVIGIKDPDPTVAGKGIALLNEAGIEVSFFDKSNQDKIYESNKAYVTEKEDLAKRPINIIFEPKPTFLDTPLVKYHMTDLSEEAQREMITRMEHKYGFNTEEYKQFLYKYGFTIKTDGVEHPTGLGLLMLGKVPYLEYPQSRVLFTTHITNGESNNKDIEGALVLMPTKIEDYLRTIFPSDINRNKFYRADVNVVSLRLLRELILNAIIHRDYSITGSCIRIDVYPDRVEIASPGSPVSPIELFQKFNVPSNSRNPKIAFIFNKMGLVEQRGLGMKDLK
jgi:ATP-dependent DNA helicase RecG